MSQLKSKNYLLVVLILVMVSNYMDRFVLSLVLEPIKQDLQLSDSQLGLLTGIAFALFYGLAGIPIARWADRGNRVTIIATATGLWSIMVALCASASNFTQLLLLRIGVGVGEAGCIPPAQSLIASCFSRQERPRALAIFSMGAFISMIVGYLLGGWAADLVGWRMTFVIMGVPGVFLAILVKLTLRDPRELPGGTVPPLQQQPSYKAVVSALWRLQTFRHLTLVYCLAYFFYFGISQWLPSFFVRVHGVPLTELGVWFSVTLGLGGLIGTLAGGYWATHFAANHEALQLRVVMVSQVLYGVMSVLLYLTPSLPVAYCLMFVGGICVSFSSGPVMAAILLLVEERMHSVMVAMLLFVANLIGLGLGPLGVGVLSDLLTPAYGEESLRYALLCFAPGFLWVGFHSWCASRSIAEDVNQVQDQTNGRQGNNVGGEALSEEGLQLEQASLSVEFESSRY